jgi:hypothetical protein
MAASRIPKADECPHAPGSDRTRALAEATSADVEIGMGDVSMSYSESNG